MNNKIPFLYKGYRGHILQTEELVSGSVVSPTNKKIILFGESVSEVAVDLQSSIDHYLTNVENKTSFDILNDYNWKQLEDYSVSVTWENDIQ